MYHTSQFCTRLNNYESEYITLGKYKELYGDFQDINKIYNWYIMMDGYYDRCKIYQCVCPRSYTGSALIGENRIYLGDELVLLDFIPSLTRHRNYIDQRSDAPNELFALNSYRITHNSYKYGILDNSKWGVNILSGNYIDICDIPNKLPASFFYSKLEHLFDHDRYTYKKFMLNNPKNSTFGFQIYFNNFKIIYGQSSKYFIELMYGVAGTSNYCKDIVYMNNKFRYTHINLNRNNIQREDYYNISGAHYLYISPMLQIDGGNYSHIDNSSFEFYVDPSSYKNYMF